jgi:hypothetical protein
MHFNPCQVKGLAIIKIKEDALTRTNILTDIKSYLYKFAIKLASPCRLRSSRKDKPPQQQMAPGVVIVF